MVLYIRLVNKLKCKKTGEVRKSLLRYGCPGCGNVAESRRYVKTICGGCRCAMQMEDDGGIKREDVG